ncbi:MAG: hypothetical protein NPIRA01_23100 [Nitrospirales bacterium]|nr:MAG: hypothetical protein NPIRA01_23100 [Nitrospirales bacterium]
MTIETPSSEPNNPIPQNRLQLWLSILFGSIIAVIVIISGVTFSVVQQNTVTEQGKALATISSALGKRLDRILFERQADINVLAHTPIMATSDHAVITQHLQLFQQIYPAYSWLGVTDEKGQVIASSIPATVGIMMNHDSAFQAIQQSTGIYIEDVKVRNILGDGLALMIASIIKPASNTEPGSRRGIFAYISLDYLAAEFNRQTTVLREQYHTISMLEWQLLRNDGLVLFDSSPEKLESVNLQTLKVPSAQAVAKGEVGFVQERHRRRNIEVLTGYSQMKGSGLASTLHWGILVHRDLDEILSSSHRILWKFAVSVIILLTLLVLLAWSIKRLLQLQVLERIASRSAQIAEKRFRTIVEAAPSGIVLIDRTGMILLANALLCEQFGYKNSDLINRSIDTLVPERFRQNHPKQRTAFFRAPEPCSMGSGRDLFGLRKDGTEFPVEIGLNPLITDQGDYVLASVIDISKRKHAEKELRDLHRTQELILQSAGEGIYGIDCQGNTTFVNVAAAKMLGYAPEELLGVPMHSTIHHTKRDGSPYPQEDCPTSTALKDAAVYHVEDEVLWRKDKTNFSAQYTCTSIRNNENKIEGAVVTFRDITEQKRYQNEILELSERLQIATQSAEIGIWDWDITNDKLTFDQRMYTLYGLSADSVHVTYETWANALHPHDCARVQEELQESLRSQTHFHSHFRVIWPDHSIHHIQAFAGINRNTTGEAIRMTGVNFDITHEKMNEEALAQHVEDLKRSNAELEQFAYVASHDLQEPLRKIRNFSELLRARAKDQLPAEFEKLLTPIVSGAMRMQALVQDLLLYSRVARGGQSAELVNLQVVVENVKNTLESAITESHATLTIGALPTLEAHATHIEQLFQNLISNSLKYHGPQPPLIEISATKINDYWQFAIRDNGIGIDPQYADRIFVIFQRLHTKQEFAGTGIGLAICKKIIEQHEGNIWVESKLSKGSTFFFTLPESRAQKSLKNTHVSLVKE